jgi:acyl-CoA dehydrogenase
MTTDIFSIKPASLDEKSESLRLEVREFLHVELKERPLREKAKSWSAFDAEFSRKLGRKGWIGMTWPKEYGGHERTAFERYVVVEELLAASAPVAAHWVGDRQTGPLILRYGSQQMKRSVLPRLASAEIFLCVGLSEPGTGSDLASLRTSAVRKGRNWVVNGTKLWTSIAHQAHHMVTLVRTGNDGEKRHNGLSQFLIDMRTPGITVKPVYSMAAEHDFNEVSLVNVEVPHECLIGQEGDGWTQVGAELAFERSGPERYLSSIRLLQEMLDAAPVGSARHAVALGRVVAGYAALRQMSLGIAGMLSQGENPALAAALVKDVGTGIEQQMSEISCDLFDAETASAGSPLREVEKYATLYAPTYSIKGGSREILRGIVARGLELR